MLELKPLNAARVRGGPYFGTRIKGRGAYKAWILFSCVCLASLTIWTPGPFGELGFAACACGLGAWALTQGCRMRPVTAGALGAIALWGFVQLAWGATEYRYATLHTSLRWAGFAGTACAASAFLSPVRERVLRAAVWFGFGVASVSVLAYYTSPGKVLWMFPAPYPDVWGAFLSRNNFAQFLELLLPVALWQSITRGGSFAWAAAAMMLAAGLASASRAGAALLLVESLAILCRFGRTRAAAMFLAAVAAIAAVAGGGTLVGRLSQSDAMRPEIYRSALAMIAERPVTGYGLGTFAVVYPEFARFDAGVTVDHAHSDWLEWAAEGGVPLALVWGLLAASMARPAWRSVWGIGVLALFLHAFVDYPFARSGIGAWGFLFIGALASENREPHLTLH